MRTHEPFISALIVQIDATSDAHRATYFDTFGATALHLWATGLPSQLASWTPDSSSAWVSWVNNEGRGENGEIIGGLGPNPPGRIGYQVGDEPRTPEDLQAMGAGVAAVHAADPDGLAWINLCCANEIDAGAYADIAVQTHGADLVSYDKYARGPDAYEGLEIFRDAGLRNDVPYWRYMKSYLEPDETFEDLDASDLRWDAMSGALYGFTGHTWFLYQIDANPGLATGFFVDEDNLDGARTEAFSAAAALNRELRVLGETLSQLTSVDVRYVPAFGALTLPDHTEEWSPGAGGEPFLAAIERDDAYTLEVSLGFFVDDAGERYFAVQNVRHEHANFPIDSTEPAAVTLRFDFSGGPNAVRRDRLLALDARNDALVVVPLEGSGDERSVVVTLDAGDLRLFKVDTGAGFARRAGSY